MQLHWSSLTHQYRDEKQCLASFIVWQAAEVLSGVKPANLVNVFNEELPCGRNIYHLWSQHRGHILMREGLRSFELSDNHHKKLVLLYSPRLLEQTLGSEAVKATLCSQGYRYSTTAEALSQLGKRTQAGPFPHEIGFFLGYPAKDVMGFMGVKDLPLSGSGPWKIYGDLESSLAVIREHKTAKAQIIESLVSGSNPLSLLQKPRDFFSGAA